MSIPWTALKSSMHLYPCLLDFSAGRVGVVRELIQAMNDKYFPHEAFNKWV